MEAALYLLAAIGVVGAFDTLFYHEWTARLPARGSNVRTELLIHADRDFLPWIEWRGAWAVVLAGVFAAEIVLTMWDFLIEKRARREFGDVLPGERVTHNTIGIVYGAMLVFLAPTVLDWFDLPTALVVNAAPAPVVLGVALTLMGVGLLVSGMRDAYAAFGLPHSGWPWTARA